MSRFLLFVGTLFMFHSVTCLGEPNNYDLRQNKIKTAIRRKVLKDYDAVIGPVKYGPNAHLNIAFKFSITNLVDVSTKDQTLQIDGWVLQQWTDEFLSWKPKLIQGMEWTIFSREEIWVPRIALLNNANRKEKLAGGPTKFITNVGAHFTGRMHWLSPASFTSTCEQNVKKWPMDTQTCILVFGSSVYPMKNLRLKPIKDTYKKGSISNGLWTIENVNVSIGTTDHQKCCDKTYSTIKYTITMTRKPDYFVFYLAPPVIILAFLAMMSFFIPTESGERIGFITTILLALMVFLLMIPEYLPKTSDQLPVLGVLMILAMVIISAVLIATIFILMCYHSEGEPSTVIQKLLFPQVTLCKIKPTVKLFKKRNESLRMKENHEELKDAPDEEAMQTKMDVKITWQKISRKLNWIFFFVIFVVAFVAMLFVLL